MEGLGVYLLGGQFTAEQALDALDAHLDLLFATEHQGRLVPAPGCSRPG
jgi:hypothetical protein